MIREYFKRGREYWALKNYKYEGPFHVAAQKNALDALKLICGKAVYIEELIRKDFKGDTPIHLAAKNGSKETL
jgi:hypothetical protein